MFKAVFQGFSAKKKALIIHSENLGKIIIRVASGDTQGIKDARGFGV